MLNGANFFGHVKNMLYLCTVKEGKREDGRWKMEDVIPLVNFYF